MLSPEWRVVLCHSKLCDENIAAGQREEIQWMLAAICHLPPSRNATAKNLVQAVSHGSQPRISIRRV